MTDEWRQISEAQLELKLRAASMDYIHAHPGDVAKVVWWDTRRALDLASLALPRHTASTISVTAGWAVAGVICFWIVGLLALAGAFTRSARRAPWWVWAM